VVNVDLFKVTIEHMRPGRIAPVIACDPLPPCNGRLAEWLGSLVPEQLAIDGKKSEWRPNLIFDMM
jgi:hypothetical protein